jgi:hypothetical protein
MPALGMETAVLDGIRPGKVETTEQMLKDAEGAFALMGTACEAVKGHRWDEAEEMLRRIQGIVHQLRVDVRDERLPLEPLGIGTPERSDDSRRDGGG